MPMSPCQRGLPGSTKPEECAGRELVQPFFETLRDPLCKIVFIHREIPFDVRKAAKAWVAREQWVFTLPSEQPITCAVSETSSSSQ
jgi:hypothetical protein